MPRRLGSQGRPARPRGQGGRFSCLEKVRKPPLLLLNQLQGVQYCVAETWQRHALLCQAGVRDLHDCDFVPRPCCLVMSCMCNTFAANRVTHVLPGEVCEGCVRGVAGLGGVACLAGTDPLSRSGLSACMHPEAGLPRVTQQW